MKTGLHGKLLAMAAAVLGLGACSPADKQADAASAAAATESKRVAITSIVEHPALDAIRNGVIEQLKAEGFEEGKNLSIDFESAQGNPSTAAQIAKKFAGDNPDVIVAITTPSAQAVAAVSKTVPLVFAGVTDPVAAKLISNWEASGSNITGVSDYLPLEPQIELMKKLVPGLKSVGYVYSPGEVNSTTVLAELKRELAKHNIGVAAVPAQRTTDVLAAARSLKGKAQLIYTSMDNNVVSAYDSMHKAAKEMKIPLVAANTESVAKGAVAAIGMNSEHVGRESGKLAARVLRGEAAGSLPPYRADKTDLYISLGNAAEQGVQISDELKAQAVEILP